MSPVQIFCIEHLIIASFFKIFLLIAVVSSKIVQYNQPFWPENLFRTNFYTERYWSFFFGTSRSENACQ